jgi:uncharacterized protein YndB with AHSA1/START domain
LFASGAYRTNALFGNCCFNASVYNFLFQGLPVTKKTPEQNVLLYPARNLKHQQKDQIMNTTETLQVELKRVFPATKEQLFEAWTQPDELKQWWHPLGRKLKQVENDVRSGGSVVYEFEDGLKVSGTYQEAVPGEKLVYTWNWELPDEPVENGKYLLHISFEGAGGQSTLSIRQENFTHEHAIQPHREGWEHALDNLEDYLEKNS